ncbi:hypothetical protein F4778DRAFT_463428 [Xylariomycetidae sp. FL2044]|nr:hypothetical protein F4778DRAFT_463428 [Xylariomycetidae sp. FL2044]
MSSSSLAGDSVFSVSWAPSTASTSYTAASTATFSTVQDGVGIAAAGGGQPVLPCELAGFGCEATFHHEDTGNWIDHITAGHMYDKLPKKAVCWFCDDEFDEDRYGDRRTAFEYRLLHVREHIIDGGLTVDNMRADFHLLEHLRRHRLIADSTYHLYRRIGTEQRPPGTMELYAPGQKPPERMLQEERDSQVIHDLQKEERHRRRHHDHHGHHGHRGHRGHRH